jgi:hypothetical protein
LNGQTSDSVSGQKYSYVKAWYKLRRKENDYNSWTI